MTRNLKLIILFFRTKFHELLSYFPNYETIFTDGSKDGDTAGSACVTPSDTYKCRLPDNASIFSAEIKAIDLALDHIEQSRSSDFVIFSDSLSVLQSLHNRNIEHPLLLGVLLKHNELAELNNIVFCWLPSHVGIKGNEKADIAAKSALSLNISDLKIPFTDFKPSINTFVHSKWQNTAVLNKLHSIKPSLGEWQPSYRIDRKEEVTLARLRIGHTFITHSFLLKGEDWPLCIPCQEPFSVKHFLLDCTDFRMIRSRFYRVNSLKELYDTVEPARIFSFLKEIEGWSGGAMVLGKLPVPGRPTIWITVGQGPTALAVGAGGGCLDIFTLIYPFFPLSPSLWETARYRLKYCLKGPLNPKSTNQPINLKEIGLYNKISLSKVEVCLTIFDF